MENCMKPILLKTVFQFEDVKEIDASGYIFLINKQIIRKRRFGISWNNMNNAIMVALK